jgi:septum formation protein
VKYQGNKISFVETTKVRFLELTDAELWYYIDKYSPMDKAGSYGIQEWIGRIAIDKIEGSYENVMGLPTQRLYRELQKIVK